MNGTTEANISEKKRIFGVKKEDLWYYATYR